MYSSEKAMAPHSSTLAWKIPWTEEKPSYALCTFISDSVQFSRSVVSDSLQPHELQHARPPCPSLTPRVYANSCPLSQ